MRAERRLKPSAALRWVHSRASQLGGLAFFRFCVIGGVGFLVDAVVLLGLIHGLGFDPLAARLASFACAVLMTFELNRRWTFRDSAPQPYWLRLASYLGVQGFGFGCNYLVYAGCYLVLQPAKDAPLVALAIASIVALFVNYAGLRFAVFRPDRGSRD